MVEKKKCVRLARIMRNGVLCSDEECCTEKAYEVRRTILRKPCECGALGDILMSADIDIDKKITTRWEMPFIENNAETAMTPQQKIVWRDVKYCPFCGRLLRRIE